MPGLLLFSFHFIFFLLSFVEIRPHYVAQARLKFTIFLARSLECCGYKYGHDAGQNGFSCRPVFCLIKFWPRVSTALDLSRSTNKTEIGWPLLVFFIESVQTSFSRLLDVKPSAHFVTMWACLTIAAMWACLTIENLACIVYWFPVIIIF